MTSLRVSAFALFGAALLTGSMAWSALPGSPAAPRVTPPAPQPIRSAPTAVAGRPATAGPALQPVRQKVLPGRFDAYPDFLESYAFTDILLNTYTPPADTSLSAFDPIEAQKRAKAQREEAIRKLLAPSGKIATPAPETQYR